MSNRNRTFRIHSKLNYIKLYKIYIICIGKNKNNKKWNKVTSSVHDEKDNNKR